MVNVASHNLKQAKTKITSLLLPGTLTTSNYPHLKLVEESECFCKSEIQYWHLETSSMTDIKCTCTENSMVISIWRLTRFPHRVSSTLCHIDTYYRLSAGSGVTCRM